MKRIKILFIIIIAIVGAYIIYNHFDNTEQDIKTYNKFSSEYTLVDTENKFNYTSIDEVINILSNGSGIIYFCTPESNWCQYYSYYLNEAVKDEDVIINYLNIKNYRELNTVKYQKIVELLDSHIYVDDTNSSKIFMPDLTFVNNGKIVAHNNETSLITSESSAEEYWTQDKIDNFISSIKESIILMNEEIIEDETIESDIEE